MGQYTPDWAGLIKGDAGLIDAQNALAAGGVQDLTGRNAAIQRAYVEGGFNFDPAALAKQLGMNESDLQDIIGPDAQKLQQEANDAKLTTSSRLDQANTDAIGQIKAALNKRGLLNSGETGYELDRQNTSYGQAQFDARNKLLDYIQQYQQGYVAAQQAKAGQLASAYSDAADRQYQSNQGSAGFTAQFDHTDASGAAVYRGPDGQLYNADGSTYTPPAPAQAPRPTGLTIGGGTNMRVA